MDGVGMEEAEAGDESTTMMRDINEEVVMEKVTPIAVLPSVIKDYVFRGKELHSYNLYEMYRNTESVGTSF